MEHEEGSFESFLTWTSSHLGISDSTTTTTTNQSHHSLGHSLCVSIFPHSGGYSQFSIFIIITNYFFCFQGVVHSDNNCVNIDSFLFVYVKKFDPFLLFCFW
jgi:hypothetical protein